MSNRDYRKECMRDFKPYVVGKPIEELRRELGIEGEIAKLASNENPLGVSPKALEAVRSQIETINLYPDDNHYYFKKALEAKFGIAPQQVYCASGSVEIIEVIGSTFLEPEDEVVVSMHSFAMYAIAVKKAGAKLVQVPMKDKYYFDLPAMAKAITKKTKVVFLANPNNPTGTWFTSDEFDAFMEQVPEDVLVVYDSAYREFITEPNLPNPRKWLDAGRDIIILHTFSKAYGLAGLRIGYGYGPERVMAQLGTGRTPFNVNSLAQAAAIAALDDDEFVARSREFTRKELDWMIEQLSDLPVEIPPTQGNFILIDTQRDSQELFLELQRRGIIVRPMGGYGFPNAIQVNVGRHDENERFVSALRELLKQP